MYFDLCRLYGFYALAEQGPVLRRSATMHRWQRMFACVWVLRCVQLSVIKQDEQQPRLGTRRARDKCLGGNAFSC